MNMNRDEKTDALGRIGEKIMVNYFIANGKLVQESIDPFDRYKDLVVDGMTVEVKTQVPFMLENAFTFRENQLKKCRSVDSLYFIAAPAPKHSYKWTGWIFAVEPDKFLHRKRLTKDGRTMLLVDIVQEAVTPIMKIKDEELNIMRKYTVSEY